MVMRLRSRILQAFPLPRRPPRAGFFKNCGSSLTAEAGDFIFRAGWFLRFYWNFSGYFFAKMHYNIILPEGGQEKGA